VVADAVLEDALEEKGQFLGGRERISRKLEHRVLDDVERRLFVWTENTHCLKARRSVPRRGSQTVLFEGRELSRGAWRSLPARGRERGRPGRRDYSKRGLRDYPAPKRFIPPFGLTNPDLPANVLGPPFKTHDLQDLMELNSSRSRNRRNPDGRRDRHPLPAEEGRIRIRYPGGRSLHLRRYLQSEEGEAHPVRHEQGALHAADGTPGPPPAGVALVTDGPGVQNAVTGSPRVLDSIPWCHHGTGADAGHREDAFQECDTVGITRPCVKHNFLVRT